METLVGAEGNGEGKFKESRIHKTNSTFSSPNLGADPVVYKLVRVDGDGKLVPATDDELMEVGNLLADDKIEMHLVADAGPTGRCIFNERSSSGMPKLESSEGLSNSENAEADTGKLNTHLEESDFSSQSLSKSLNNQPSMHGECSNSSNGLVEGQQSTSAVCTSSKPEFSRLMGEICLDNLSIKELHETFKATFGRETTVKDKQWLKRRIAMGLTNSCDVSTSSFIIKDNKLVSKGGEGSCNKEAIEDQAVKPVDGSGKESSLNPGSKMEDQQIVSSERLRTCSKDYSCADEDPLKEQRNAKRIRKPTRRYIEELSEVESKEHGGKSIASVKNLGLGLMSSRSNTRPVRIASSNRITLRLDSLGGSGVQIPYVSRVRRSRPRKNVKALMEFHPNGIGMAAKLVKEAVDVHSSEPNRESGGIVLKASSAPEQIQQQFVVEPEKDNHFSEVASIEQGQNMEPKNKDPSVYTPDDNPATVRAVKGGVRRKHHRAWTLSEVMKLVEGVSKYGAGRWSEIKRLAFASYSYRTSVDLKDKWRNLLKASLAQTPPDSRMGARKHASSVPIPMPVLLRVRELAEMQSQFPPNLSSSKLTGSAGRNVNETRSGYL
ncbi:hypothetical protein AB3S75_003911 [Citrus x aurantiifolia]